MEEETNQATEQDQEVYPLELEESIKIVLPSGIEIALQSKVMPIIELSSLALQILDEAKQRIEPNNKSFIGVA